MVTDWDQVSLLGRSPGETKSIVTSKICPNAQVDRVQVSGDMDKDVERTVGKCMKIDVGIFAYNEGERIAGLIAQVGEQISALVPGHDVIVHVLANGCRDNTAEAAEAAIAQLAEDLANCFIFHDLQQPGKARTWNFYVHQQARKDAELLFFVDADIKFFTPETFANMVTLIHESPLTQVVSSFPVKDIATQTAFRGSTAKLIASGGATIEDVKTAICGQLYVAKHSVLEPIFMPVGLPVEDGYLRAMVLTSNFTEPEHFERVLCVDSISHEYESITSFGELVKHQTRIVIGSAINAMIFGEIKASSNPGLAVKRAASTDEWLAELIQRELPKFPYGDIPFRFATKRLYARKLKSPSQAFKMLLGGGFDLFIYLWASIKMLRGAGSGFW